jgi:transketolase
MAKVSCRKAFAAALLERARENTLICTIATDSRGSVSNTAMFAELPNQSIELGIAEQNAVAFAAGLSLTGRNVFVTGPATFLAARAFEQVKVDVAYNKTNVKIVGVSGGVSYGPLGGTHTSLHDIASLRTLPNIEVFIPSDSVQTQAVTQYLCGHKGPAYMRTGRGDVEAVYDNAETFEIHKAKMLSAGMDVTIIACGEMVYAAKLAGEILRAKGISARVLDLFCLKPADETAIINAAGETGAIVTIEEHSTHGGLGELVAHITGEHCPVPVKIIGFPDQEYKVGKSAELFAHYGLTPENIASEAEKLVEKKKCM